MDPDVYDLLRQHEDRHWWFRGRRAIISDQIGRMGLLPGARILDVGCGTGGNGPALARLGALFGVESDPDAARTAAKRGYVKVLPGRLPDDLPFAEGGFALATALDVIEHVDDDAGSLAAIRTRLAPKGQLLITVPAYAWLWGQHDELLHHKRRYERGTLVALVEAAGFEVLRASFMNFWLFPLAITARLMGSSGKGNPAGLIPPPAPLNAAFAAIMGSERFLLRATDLPCGLSLLLTARVQ
jgi:SAM-dependent methyltransferase